MCVHTPLWWPTIGFFHFGGEKKKTKNQISAFVLKDFRKTCLSYCQLILSENGTVSGSGYTNSAQLGAGVNEFEEDLQVSYPNFSFWDIHRGRERGEKHTHSWHWWFPRASHVNVMPSPLPFPAEKRPCFSSLRSDRWLSSDLVALPTKQGCQCDHWRTQPGSRPSRQCCGPGWTPGMGVHSHAHRQVFPQSWCSQLVAGWRTQLPAKLPVSGHGLRQVGWAHHLAHHFSSLPPADCKRNYSTQHASLLQHFKGTQELLFWWRPQRTSQRKSGILRGCLSTTQPPTFLSQLFPEVVILEEKERCPGKRRTTDASVSTGHTLSWNALALKLVRVGRGNGSPIPGHCVPLHGWKQTSSSSCHGEIPPNIVNGLTIRLNFYITDVCLIACIYSYFQGKWRQVILDFPKCHLKLKSLISSHIFQECNGITLRFPDLTLWFLGDIAYLPHTQMPVCTNILLWVAEHLPILGCVYVLICYLRDV